MKRLNDDIEDILSFVAPGTDIRVGLDNILDAKTGGLIVIGDDKDVLDMVDGGFFIDCEYNPQRIYELAKMDGAIILDNDTSRILYANVQLQPDSSIETSESGTRHRTAERVAKETGKLVIAVSGRRNRISLYKNENKYVLRKISDIMSEANQAIKTVERYREVIEKALINLTLMEYDDLVTLYEVTSIVQKYELMWRVAKEAELYIAELGSEGRLIDLQLEEMLMDIKTEMNNLILDYDKVHSSETWNTEKEKVDILEDIFLKLSELTPEELMELTNIVNILGYSKRYSALDIKIIPKGYRVLGKMIRLTNKDITTIVGAFDGLPMIVDASEDELAELENISRFKARTIKNGIKRLKFTAQIEKGM